MHRVLLNAEIKAEIQLCFCVLQIQYWPGSGRLDGLVAELCAFPSVHPATPTWLHLASNLSSLVTREAVTCLVTRADDQGLPAQQLLSRWVHSFHHFEWDRSW